VPGPHEVRATALVSVVIMTGLGLSAETSMAGTTPAHNPTAGGNPPTAANAMPSGTLKSPTAHPAIQGCARHAAQQPSHDQPGNGPLGVLGFCT
jgi:hypothetical protein